MRWEFLSIAATLLMIPLTVMVVGNGVNIYGYNVNPNQKPQTKDLNLPLLSSVKYCPFRISHNLPVRLRGEL